MRIGALAAGLLALGLLAGCAQAPAPTGDAEAPELSPEVKSLVLDEVPSDIPHPLFVDLGGKAEIVGYALEPEGSAAPGSKLSLKLYWRSTGKLDAGYLPFTELVTPGGQRIEVSGNGPVRSGALSPANWEPGKVYVDELEITVPADIDAARFAIVAGLKTQPVAPEQPATEQDDGSAKEDGAEKPSEGNFGAVYLSVLSGPADSKYGAVITSVQTGVTPGARRALAARGEKGALKRLPRAPGGRPARPQRPKKPAPSH